MFRVPRWLSEVQTSSSDGNIPVKFSTGMMQAVREFLGAENWDVTRQVVEARQGVLFQPEFEILFEQNMLMPILLEISVP